MKVGCLKSSLWILCTHFSPRWCSFEIWHVLFAQFKIPIWIHRKLCKCIFWKFWNLNILIPYLSIYSPSMSSYFLICSGLGLGYLKFKNTLTMKITYPGKTFPTHLTTCYPWTYIYQSSMWKTTYKIAYINFQKVATKKVPSPSVATRLIWTTLGGEVH
jgi:hypothetical protein